LSLAPFTFGPEIDQLEEMVKRYELTAKNVGEFVDAIEKAEESSGKRLRK
jgi:hypothetical protein